MVSRGLFQAQQFCDFTWQNIFFMWVALNSWAPKDLISEMLHLSSKATGFSWQSHLVSPAAWAQGLKLCILHFQVPLMIAVSVGNYTAWIFSGESELSLVYISIGWPEWQGDFYFQVVVESIAGGRGRWKCLLGPSLVPGARGSPWPPEGNREDSGEAAEVPPWGCLCCAGLVPCAPLSAGAALGQCLQMSEHGCWLSLAATARFSQAGSKTCVKPHSFF